MMSMPVAGFAQQYDDQDTFAKRDRHAECRDEASR